MKQKTTRPVSIAVAALGGQGGGVLAQWIVDLAEANDYLVQSTSVPGVAQRTGATIYFLELFPGAEARRIGKAPVFALMPVPGDVDICVASELVEAGRSIIRGFVSPDLTTLIASNHRVYAVAEKEVPGDGRIDSDKIREAAAKAAKRLVMFDMERASAETGCAISAVLFGALAGSGALPFPRAAFEETIKRSGKAVSLSLAGFSRGFDEAQGRGKSFKDAAVETVPLNAALVSRVAAFPAPARPMITAGVKGLIDYQDQAYAGLYLDRLAPFAKAAPAGDKKHRLLTEMARYLALWMGFEDVIRVAEFKTRLGRYEKISAEVHAAPGQYFNVVEYFHPRYEEFCDTLPAWIGGPLARSARVKRLMGPLFSKGRNLTTTKLSGFLPLYLLASLKGLRRGSLRFRRENAAIEAWLGEVAAIASSHYELAVELAECPRLIKGYGDTHERGFGRFTKIIENLPAIKASADAVAGLRALKEAGLAAEDPRPFEAALAKIG
jgi:indolepyruvate ferredoxin oxidoreductase beta subunit